MNLQEMIAKIVNLDPKKDYTISESSPVETIPVTTANLYVQDIQPTLQQSTPTSHQTTPIVTQDIKTPSDSSLPPVASTSPESIQNEDYKKLYEDMLTRNKLLEQANFNLLNNMPVQQKTKSTEELILEVVGRGDLVNGTD